jgi:hypothetical protein
MTPSPPTARTTLSYPLYAADFDPQNPDFLLVGGGGGSSSTGVPNKVSLIDCSRVHELKEVVDIDLSRSEDSVMSLAVAQSSNTSLTAYAGINSGVVDQANGKNEHLRSFRIDLPRKRKAREGRGQEKQPDTVCTGTTEALGRAQFFTPQAGVKNETYQRIVRLSPSSLDSNKPRITAIASSLANENEIVLLKAGLAPGSGNEIARLNLGKDDAVDLDFAPASDAGDSTDYTMAYCLDYDVSIYRLSGGNEGVRTQTRVLYSTPQPSGSASKPKFKALRFLSSKHILLLQNLPDRKGVELSILRKHMDGNTAIITLQKRLSKNMKMATRMDVCILSESPIGDQQILIAVAGQNDSIEVLRVEYSKRTGMSSFFPYTILKDVHSGPITSLVFSTFVPPSSPVTEDTKPHCVKLASVGVDKNVVVHSLPLRPFPSSSKTPQYVLVPPRGSGLMSTAFSIFMAILVLSISFLILQVVTEISGAKRPYLTEWFPSTVKEMITKPSIVADGILAPSEVLGTVKSKASGVSELLDSNEFYTAMLADVTDAVKDIPSSVSSVATALTDLVAEQATLAAEATEGAKRKAIIVRDKGLELSTEIHHDAELVEGETLRKWEDLHEDERVGWRKRLSEAGHWSANEGESVLKGILFSELGGLAAQIAGGN